MELRNLFLAYHSVFHIHITYSCASNNDDVVYTVITFNANSFESPSLRNIFIVTKYSMYCEINIH